EPVALRLERPVVDGLGLLHLSVRPRPDLVRRGDGDADRGGGEGGLWLLEETEEIFHHVLRLSSGWPVLGQLDVERQALELLHHDVEGLRQGRLEHLLTPYDRTLKPPPH